MGTKIPYVDEVWNVVVGCTKCSPGCDNCWAEKMAKRQVGMEEAAGRSPVYGSVVDNKGWMGNVICDEARLKIPLHWRKSRKILTCSMGDWCHPNVPFEFRDRMLAVAALCPQHDFWFLTKREKGMMEYFKAVLTEQVYCENSRNDGNTRTRIYHEALKIVRKSQQQSERASCNMWNGKWPLPNVHLGVTICNQKEMDEKGPILLSIPAAHHWISFEPMLGPIDATRVGGDKFGWGRSDVLAGLRYTSATALEEGSEWHTERINKINLVIIGCESGPNRRPIARKHIKDLYEQCKAAGVKVLVKQMAENEDGMGKVIHDPERIKDVNLKGKVKNEKT